MGHRAILSKCRARTAVGCAGVLALLSCSSARVGPSQTGAPSVTLPSRIAEGSGEPGRSSGGAPSRSPSGPDAGAAPAPDRQEASDPPPLTTPLHWDYSLHYVKGDVTVERVDRVTLPAPAPSPRRLGRFAVELWIGQELVDRVRFDFPLLAADVAEGRKRPLHDSPRFAPGADTRITVRVPASDRATRALLVDRLTGRVLPLDWPPREATDVGTRPAR